MDTLSIYISPMVHTVCMRWTTRFRAHLGAVMDAGLPVNSRQAVRALVAIHDVAEANPGATIDLDKLSLSDLYYIVRAHHQLAPAGSFANAEATVLINWLKPVIDHRKPLSLILNHG